MAVKKICIADLKHKCVIEKRTIVPALVGTSSPSENFSTVYTGWFKIETGFYRSGGTARFSGVNIDEKTTHLFITRHRLSIAKLDGAGEHFIRFSNTHYRIFKIANIDENSEWLLFQCAERGSDQKEATDA